MPYNVYGGMQDHDSWNGPSNSWSGEVNVADWITVGTGDGMYNRVDPSDSRWLYNTSQFGDHKRVDQSRRTMTDIMPKRPAGQPPLRWNWNTPLLLSPHNPQIVYTGAQVLLRSLNRGDAWQEISPDLTTGDESKTFGRGNIQYCTITTIAESPVTPGVIWIGTDDGKVQVTRTHGAVWTDATAAIAKAGGPADRWVSRVFASSTTPARRLSPRTGSARTTPGRISSGRRITARPGPDLGQPAGSANQCRLAGPHEPEPALRRQRQGRLGLDRRRRRDGCG